MAFLENLNFPLFGKLLTFLNKNLKNLLIVQLLSVPPCLENDSLLLVLYRNAVRYCSILNLAVRFVFGPGEKFLVFFLSF
jgi:hypothetical protein